MKKTSLLLLTAFVIITGCHKQDPLCAGCGNPVILRGQIVVTVKDTVSIQTAFSLFDTLGLAITGMQQFNYNSALPLDSFNAVKNHLVSRPYIDSLSQALIVPAGITNAIQVRIGFLAMNLASQQDWLALKAQMMLTDNNDSMKMIHLQVPDGQEISWSDSLAKYSIVKNANPVWLAP